MTEPARHLILVLSEAGETLNLPSPSIILPGVPRVGDDVKTVDGIRRVTRVIWQDGMGNWVELWTKLVEPNTQWCPLHQHYKWCEHNGGVLGGTGYEAPPS